MSWFPFGNCCCFVHKTKLAAKWSRTRSVESGAEWREGKSTEEAHDAENVVIVAVSVVHGWSMETNAPQLIGRCLRDADNDPKPRNLGLIELKQTTKGPDVCSAESVLRFNSLHHYDLTVLVKETYCHNLPACKSAWCKSKTTFHICNNCEMRAQPPKPKKHTSTGLILNLLIPCAGFQTCKAPYPTSIIISASRGNSLGPTLPLLMNPAFPALTWRPALCWIEQLWPRMGK